MHLVRLFVLRSRHSRLTLAPDAAAAAAFGTEFIAAFKRTAAYEIWDDATDPMVFDLFEHKVSRRSSTKSSDVR
jgi:hypothetical protein